MMDGIANLLGRSSSSQRNDMSTTLASGPPLMDRVFQGSLLAQDAAMRSVVEHLARIEEETGLIDAVLYYDFPVFKDHQDRLFRADLLLGSRSHGLVLLGVSSVADSAVDAAHIASE